MSDVKKNNPANKEKPLQRTQQDVDKKLAVGDVIMVKGNDEQKNGLYVVADMSHSGDKIKAIPVRMDERKNELTLDKTRKAIELDANSPDITRQSIVVVNREILKNEHQKKNIEKDKEHAVSFSVVSNGSPDGYVTGGNSYERIVTGTTTNGVMYKATISGGRIDKSTLNNIADNIAKSRDYSNEKLDERTAYDNIQDVMNQDPSIETIHIEGGPTINRDEIAFEVSTPNGTEYFDPLNPDGDIKDDIEDGKDYEDDVEIPEQMGKPTPKQHSNEMDYSPSIDELNKAFAEEYDDDEPFLDDFPYD